MADATVPRAGAREAVPSPSDARAPAALGWLPLSRGLLLLWAAIVAAITLFLVFGAVRVGAGNWLGRRLAVTEIWSRFLGYLANQGASPVIILLVAATAAVSLVMAAIVLWLALGLRDERAAEPDDGSVAR